MCGNFAFSFLATGGVYIAGSIANSLRDRIRGRVFNDGFEQTGPASLRSLIQSIPVKLVTYEETGLLGAATYATWAADGRL
jgi:glucokinase